MCGSRRNGNSLMIYPHSHSQFFPKAYLRRFLLKGSRGRRINTHLQTPTISRKLGSVPSPRTHQLRNWQDPPSNCKNTDLVCLLTTKWNCRAGDSLLTGPLPWLRRKPNKPPTALTSDLFHGPDPLWCLGYRVGVAALIPRPFGSIPRVPGLQY